MFNSVIRRLAIGLTLALAGCVSQHNILFMTKSNVGLDMDSTAPTAEIAISRRELVIAPSFEGGQQPPVLATFRADAGQDAASTFAFGGSSVFVGGNAAVLLARADGTEAPELLCLTSKPTHVQVGRSKSKTKIELPDATTIAPFIFGTDTSFGLKIGYSGTSVAIDTIKIGFNRKEFAKAPIVLRSGTGEQGRCKSGQFEVLITPFYAGIERNTSASASAAGPKTGVRVMQAFATGEAAEKLVQHPEFQKILLNRLEPELRKSSARRRKHPP